MAVSLGPKMDIIPTAWIKWLRKRGLKVSPADPDVTTDAWTGKTPPPPRPEAETHPTRKRTAEELIPTPTPTAELEKQARLTNIVIKGYDQQTKMYNIVSGGKKFQLTADQLQMRAQFPDAMEGPPASRLKTEGDFAEVLKNQKVGKEALLKWAKNLETEELREKYGAEVEKLGDIPSINIGDLPPIFQGSAILQSMASDIPDIALAAAAAGWAGLKTGKPRAAAVLAGTTAAATIYGKWQAGTATGSASTTGEAQSQFRAAYQNIEKMKMNLRRGEATGAEDSEGNPLSPAEAFNQEYFKILESYAILKRSYDDGFFNLKSPVGKEYQKVVGWVRFEKGHMEEFAAAIVTGGERAGPEFTGEFPETGGDFFAEEEGAAP